MSNMIKPNRLKKGDTIAIVASSWGGHSVFPHVVDKGIQRIEELGFNVIRGDTFNYSNEELYENPKLRAEDINKQFLDSNVDGIITLIGGEDGVRVLPYLDVDLIKKNFKFFMGYSDSTNFNAYLNANGLVTFNGPSVMAGFAESKKLEDDFLEFINKFLFESWDEFEYKKFKRYTNKYLDWSNSENLEKENTNYIENKDDWNFIQGSKIVQGQLYGGCIEVLEFLKGTKFWPSQEFWNGKILFFETSEEKPLPEQVKWMLRNYGSQEILSKVNGIMFGRARDYTDEEKKELERVVLQICKEFDREDLTVVTGIDFGHTDPQIILPLGCKIEINPIDKTIVLKESPFR